MVAYATGAYSLYSFADGGDYEPVVIYDRVGWDDIQFLYDQGIVEFDAISDLY